MNKAKNESALLSITLDKAATTSLQAQLAEHLRRLILRRALMPGDRLPSSRVMAADLSVSRITTSAVYDQLISEGYLEGKQRSGVFVEANLPDFIPDVDTDDSVQISKAPRRTAPRIPFEMSVPDVSQFPFREWSKHHDKVWRKPDPTFLHSPDRRGFADLRLQISEHLAEWRGVKCEADQIIITSGAVEGLEIIAETILGKDEAVFLEDPAYPVVRRHLSKIGVATIPIPTDEHGLDTGKMKGSKRLGRAALVTPSRQFPLGMTMPLNRRLELLRWAEVRDAMVIEDDFDSEFRFEGQPLPALMSLSSTERVIYMGSFSKVMFPMLRLSYVVFPKSLERKVDDVLTTMDARTSFMLQPVLASFMASGEFGSHVRRMRRLYASRQHALINAIEMQCNGLLSILGSPSGMHLVARIDPELMNGVSDVGVAAHAADAGISVQPLSSFYEGKNHTQGLVLGFAGFDEDQIRSSISKLSAVLVRNLKRQA